MKVTLPFHTEKIEIQVPESTTVYTTTYQSPMINVEEMFQKAIRQPIGSPPLKEVVSQRRSETVAVVVSDITRPIPYPQFFPLLMEEIESAGVRKSDITIIIATGMHRSSTEEERSIILGEHIAGSYEIIDHDAKAGDLMTLPTRSWMGNVVKLNRRFVQAGCRIITGLVEPHFMAGFSGGRKAICPGLASLETVQQFHGYRTLADIHAENGRLSGNPCHLEALSVAKAAGVDFSLNVVLNEARRIVKVTAGDLDASHRRAVEFVRLHACPKLEQEFDVVISSCAGYPLDTTFYQCVKGFVGALPAVKPEGKLIMIGGCREGIGSESYTTLMRTYSKNWRQFLTDISTSPSVIHDQWQLQMHTRVLKKIGQDHLLFVNDVFSQHVLDELSVHGIATKDVRGTLQSIVEKTVENGESVCVIPEGPYCTPIVQEVG